MDQSENVHINTNLTGEDGDNLKTNFNSGYSIFTFIVNSISFQNIILFLTILTLKTIVHIVCLYL